MSLFGRSTLPIPWWLLLLEGIAAVFIGVLLLTETKATLYTLVVFLGIYWLITGILDLVMLFVDQSQWGWKLFSGIIGVLAGVIIIRDPIWAAVLVPTTLVWLLGAAGIAIGIIALIRAFTGGGWAAAILGVISLLLGGLLLFNTVTSTVVLIYLVAIWAIIGGVLAVVGSFLVRGGQLGGAAQPPLAPA